jgi:hypothetical protein
MAEKINEPVEVWASFAKGKLRPLRFHWRGRAYPVRKTEFVHFSQKGAAKRYYFSVVAPGATYQLIFNSQTFGWRLAKVEANDKTYHYSS